MRAQTSLKRTTIVSQKTVSQDLVDFDAVRVVPSKPFTSEEGPLEFFQRMFDNATFDWLVKQTNLYAAQNSIKHWKDVSMEELKAFIGLLIGMELHQLPRVELFWSSNLLFRVQPIADVMTVKQFKKIRQVLHANDNSKTPKRGQPIYNKLYKLRPLLDIMNSAFMDQAVPSSSQSADEAMIKFKGRSSIKQYMPLKPVNEVTRFGCDPTRIQVTLTSLTFTRAGKTMATRLSDWEHKWCRNSACP